MDVAKLNHALGLLHRHRQHYNGSCVAACVELVLKIERRLSEGSRELQDAYPHESSGMTPYLDPAFVAKFGLVFSPAAFSSAESAKLRATLDTEQAQSRFPLVALIGGNIDPAKKSATGHMHVVFGSFGCEYLAFSKSGFLTTAQPVLSAAERLASTNLYLYLVK